MLCSWKLWCGGSRNLIRSPQAKVLVFSTWIEVLDVLSYALTENEVRYAFARTPKQLGAAIEQLQSSSSASPGQRPLQTLLLPVKQGGNGLNLTGNNDLPFDFEILAIAANITLFAAKVSILFQNIDMALWVCNVPQV